MTVSAGGGDNMMGAIGTGNVQPGVVTVSLGTSGHRLRLRRQAGRSIREGEVAAFCDSTDRWLPLVCTMNVTVATEQVRKMFGWSHEQLEKQRRDRARRRRRTAFSCRISMASAPRICRIGTGVLHGLTADNMTPAHIARATMEGVTLGLAYGLNRFRELGIEPDGNPAHRRRQQERRLAADLRGYFRRADRLPRKRGRRRARRRHPGGLCLSAGAWAAGDVSGIMLPDRQAR